MRLGRRHNMPPPHLDFWPFDLEVGVGIACDLGYPCAKFRLPRPFGFRVRADVRDIKQTDGRTTDADDRLMPRPPTGRGHNKTTCQPYCLWDTGFTLNNDSRISAWVRVILVIALLSLFNRVIFCIPEYCWWFHQLRQIWYCQLY